MHAAQLEPVPPVRGPAAIAMLCLRCLVVLAAANAPLALLASIAAAGQDAAWLPLLAAGGALAIAAVPIALVGYPAGLLTAHLMRDVRGEWRHVLTFSVVGAVLAALLVAWWMPGSGADAPAWALLEGAVGAGGARWWTGRAHARAARRGPSRRAVEPEDGIVDAQLAAREGRAPVPGPE